MSSLVQDVRHGLRLIVKNRSLTFAVVLSLSLGIGATAAVFSLIDSFLLRPMPVPESARLVRLTAVTQSTRVGALSYADVDDLRSRSQSFEGITSARNIIVGLAAQPGQQARMTLGVVVGGEFFSTLHLQPAVGRGFRAEEDQVPGRNAVAVISHALWQRDFGGGPDVLGRPLRINFKEFTIVGVAPESFDGIEPFVRPEVYVPRAMIPELTSYTPSVFTDRSVRILQVFARLKPGIGVEQARAEVTGIGAQLEQENPGTNRGYRTSVFSQLGYKVADDPDNLIAAWLFFTVAGLVLGIACVNVANLLLSTAPARTREMAIKVAMGASRARLIRQMLVESIVVAAGGTLGGLLIAALSSRFISSIEIASNLPLRLDARIDFRVALFAFAVGIGSGVLSGLIPALRCSRGNLGSLIKSSDTRAGRFGRMWGRQALVVIQVAVAVVVLVLSGLSLQSLRLSRRSDPGFRVDNVLTMAFNPGIAGYGLERTRSFYRRLIEHVQVLPGVRAAGLSQHMPLGVSSSTTNLTIEGYEMTKEQTSIGISSAVVSSGYFDALGIPVVRGRAFSAHDTAAATRVAIVNEAMADRYWPNRDVVGRRIQIQGVNGGNVEVVGVARTTKYRSLDEEPLPFLYLPIEQNNPNLMVLFVATAGDPASMIPVIRSEVAAVDPNQPVYDVRTMSEHFHQQALWAIRLVAQVISAAGTIGLALGVLGLYGILAYSVSQRTREIGIRMAVGATKGGMLRMILSQGLKLSAIGMAGGFVMTLALGPVFRGLLNGVDPGDPVVYAGVIGMLFAVTLIACYLPARRASMVDPTEALRSE